MSGTPIMANAAIIGAHYRNDKLARQLSDYINVNTFENCNDTFDGRINSL